MSGKENNTGAGKAAAMALNSPTQVANSAEQQHDGEGYPASGDELGIDGSLTPNSQDGIPSVNQNDELYVVQESLGQIEAILKAESKRRLEANKLTEEYILEYLEKLETSLNNQVSKQF